MSLLGRLLDAWRTTYDETLEPLIEALGEGEPIVATTRTAVETEWLALAADPDPAVVGRLIATPPTTETALRRRLLALVMRDADPRLTRWAAAHAKHYDFVRSEPTQVLFAQLVARAPTAAIAELVASIGLSRHAYAQGQQAYAGMIRRVAPAALVAEARSALVARPPEVSVEALWARHRAAPLDLQIRRVLGDALQAGGDPRGEFIALQLAPSTTPAMRKRIAELLGAYRDAWLGRLPWFAKAPPLFAGGFPYRLSVAWEHEIAPTLDAPEWGTIEHLDVRNIEGPSRLATILDRLPNASRLSAQEWAYDTLASVGSWPQIRVADRCVRVPTCFPNLEVCGGPAQLLAEPAHIPTLVITLANDAGIAAALASRQHGPATLGITTGGSCCELDKWAIRIARGASAAQVSFTGTPNAHDIARGPLLLAALAAAGVATVSLSAPTKVKAAFRRRGVRVEDGAPFAFI